MTRWSPITRWVAVLGVALVAGAAQAGPQVVVVQSDDLAPYRDPVPTFLQEVGVQAAVVDLHGRRAEADALVRRLRADPPDAVFCLGAKAAWAVRYGVPDAPMVYAAVQNPGRYGIEGEQVAGVAMRVDPEIHLSQFAGFFPQVRTLGVLRGPSLSDAHLADAQAAAVAVGLDLVVREVRAPRRVRTAFRELATDVDALWLQPDRDMLTPDSFRVVAEEARRRGLPLLVDTENMVRAGGLFAVIPDPEGVGSQAAALVRRILDGEAPSDLGVEAPREVEVALNTGALEQSGIEIDELLLDFVDTVVE